MHGNKRQQRSMQCECALCDARVNGWHCGRAHSIGRLDTCLPSEIRATSEGGTSPFEAAKRASANERGG